MTVSEGTVRRLEANIGALVAKHGHRRDRRAFAKYRDDPVGFIREVLGGDPWSAQVDIASRVRDLPFVVVRSCNGAGKDWLAARLALWWVYARDGMVLLTGPTERQVRQVVMGEVHRAFEAAKDLPGEMFEMALRLDRSDRAGILAFTSNDSSRLTGFHAPRTLVVVTEAQGVEPGTWEGMLACTVGADDRFLAIGNPLTPSGRFFDVSRSPRWSSVRVAASEHPNLLQGHEVIPGAVTTTFVETIAAEYGEGSGIYRSRVEGEFPEEGEESLIRRVWLDKANELWANGTLEREARLKHYTVGVDPARLGPDSTVIAIRQEGIIRELKSWTRLDTMATTGLVVKELDRLGMAPGLKYVKPDGTSWGYKENGYVRTAGSGLVVVDEVGLGGGVLDRLKEQGYTARGFNGGRTARDPRFLNARAEAFWGLRKLLEEGRLAVPHDDKLFEELLALQWTVTSAGRVKMEGKDDLRGRLGRSPDRADAVAMACLGLTTRVAVPKLPPLHW